MAKEPADALSAPPCCGWSPRADAVAVEREGCWKEGFSSVEEVMLLGCSPKPWSAWLVGWERDCTVEKGEAAATGGGGGRGLGATTGR